MRGDALCLPACLRRGGYRVVGQNGAVKWPNGKHGLCGDQAGGPQPFMKPGPVGGARAAALLAAHSGLAFGIPQNLSSKQCRLNTTWGAALAALPAIWQWLAFPGYPQQPVEGAGRLFVAAGLSLLTATPLLYMYYATNPISVRVVLSHNIDSHLQSRSNLRRPLLHIHKPLRAHRVPAVPLDGNLDC